MVENAEMIKQMLMDSRYEELKSRSLSSVIGSLMLLLLYQGTIFGSVFLKSSYNKYFVALMVISLFFRTYIYFDQKMAPRVWLKCFTFLTALSAFSWGLILCYSVMFFDGDPRILCFAAMTAGGLIASAAYSLSISKIDFLIFHFFILVAIGIAFHQSHQFDEFKNGALVIVVTFFSYIVRQRKVWSDFWHQQKLTTFELQNILEAFPGGIAIVESGVCKVINKKMVEKIGVSKENLIGMPVRSSDSGSEFLKTIAKFLEINPMNMRLHEEIVLETPLGKKEHLLIGQSISINPKLNEYIFITIDISEQKESEKELEKQKMFIEYSSKMAALGEMSSGLAHEINNPLTIIIARANQILKMARSSQPDLVQIEKISENIQKTGHRIAGIIKGLRFFARDANADPFVLTNVKDIVVDTLTFCEARFKAHNIEVKTDEIDPSLQIECQPIQISQVILNALNNAHDAVEKLDQTRWIKIRTIEKANSIQILVSDCGLGIPLDIRSKIMMPFFSTKEVGKGTGLGLSVSKGIIESHHGSLSFDFDSPNTELVITLPKPKILKIAQG